MIISKSEIFEIAWDKARYGAKKFGGKASQYFREALKMVWAWANREKFRTKIAKEAAARAKSRRAFKKLDRQLRAFTQSLPY